LKEKYPNIFLLYVPANCTSCLQPCDVILQRPFKASIQRGFTEFAIMELTKQLKEDISAATVVLDTTIATLRNKLCGWFQKAHSEVAANKCLIKKGWDKIGFADVWESKFRWQAMKANDNGELFKRASIFAVEEDEPANDDGWFGNQNVEDLLEMPVVGKLMVEEEEDTTVDATAQAMHSFRHLKSLIRGKKNTSASTSQVDVEEEP
jgi:hypothetical protein